MVHYPLYTHNLSLVGVCVKRIGKVPPPFVLMISLQGVRGAYLAVRREQFLYDDSSPMLRDSLELPEVTIDSFGEPADYHRAARPAFDALWNAAGYVRSQHFDEEGNWTGP
jgi:hypothetical protein